MCGIFNLQFKFLKGIGYRVPFSQPVLQFPLAVFNGPIVGCGIRRTVDRDIRIAILRFVFTTNVTFTYKDRKHDNQIKLMTLSAQEFIRRFLLHVLPKGFMKIRYFGFLAHINKRQAIPLIRRLIGPDEKLPEKVDETVFEMMLRLTGQDITCCPECKKGNCHTVLDE